MKRTKLKLTEFEKFIFWLLRVNACTFLALALSYLQQLAKALNKLLQTYIYRAADTWSALTTTLRSLQYALAFKQGLKNVNLTNFF